MTNNPTIDGVSRAKIHHLKIHRKPFDDLVSGRKTNEVRNCADREFREGDHVELFLIDETGNPANKSIVRTITHIQRGYGLPDDICVLSYAPIDAPAVERQDEVAFLEMELEGERRAKLELADVLGVGGEPRWKWMLSAARAQQSTISRLEAQLNNAINLDFQRHERITQLESEKEFAAATYQAARDRIAELESGRGEAPFYISVDDWNMLVRDDVEIASVRVSRTRRSKFTEPLFAAPPAPVAVVLPERKSDSGREWDSHYVAEVEGWNACLDATDALNEPAK